MTGKHAIDAALAAGVAISAAVSVVGMAFPYGFPLFSAAVGVLLLAVLMRAIVLPRIVAPARVGSLFLALYFGLVVAYMVAWIQYGGQRNFVIESDYKGAAALTALITALFVVFASTGNFERTLRWFSALTIAAMTAVGIEGFRKFYQLLQGVIIERYDAEASYPQGSALVADYNFYALAHLIALMFAVERFVATYSLRSRIALAAVSLVFVGNIFLSGSRRGLVMLGLIAALGLAVALRGSARFAFNLIRARFRRRHLANIALLILLAGGVAASPRMQVTDLTAVDTLLVRAESLGTLVDDGTRGQNAFSERTVRWEEAYRLIDEAGPLRTLIGGGFSYHDAIGRAMGTGMADYPHNVVLSLWLSNGLIGLVLSLAFIISVGVMAWQVRRVYPVLACMYGVMLVYLSTSGDQFFSLKPFFIIAAFILFAYRLERV